MAREDPPAGTPVSYSRQYRRCGKPGCAVCGPGKPGHGPYWYAYWREGGRTRSRYLGRQAPPEAVNSHTAPAVALDRSPSRAPRVRTLGGFAVWLGDEALPAERWGRRTVAALFKALLSAPGHRLQRDQALELLWPEVQPEQGAVRLRATVHRLRQVLGDGGLRYVDALLTLFPDQRGGTAGWLDADVFEATARSALAGRDVAACRSALALYGGDYLQGDPYEELAIGRREELRQQHLALLLHMADLCAAAGAVEEAEGYLRAVLRGDRCHEGAALALMRLQAGAGRPAQALRTYRHLAQALRDELDLGPEAETQTLYRTLLAQRAAKPRSPLQPDPLPPTNLPTALTSFIGRRETLAEVRRLLQQGSGIPVAGEDRAAPARMLTLTGVGGCGKTRLALQLADEILEEYPDGVWLVELAPLREPGLVGQAVARALGVQEQPARPVLETLVDALRPKQLLLILDNCEHLVAACADLASRLLTTCPALHILATSRERLDIAGEHAWPVPPLSLPEPGATTLGQLPRAEAARLFLERARAQRPDLQLTEDNAQAVARICRRLEGIPLAVELAAARVGILSLEQIAARLEESFGLLGGGPRAASPRQRTLRATLDWSYDLLAVQEQVLLQRLSVFAGGCSLEAAETVCAGDEVASAAVLDLLAGLARKSLLLLEDQAGEVRYGLLETVRRYAQEKLAVANEADALRMRHLRFFLAYARHAEQFLRGPDQAVWLARLEREIDNLRAALASGVAGAPEAGLRLASALEPFWGVRGYLSEGTRWLEALLQRGHDAPQPVRAAALTRAGSLARMQGDYPRAQRLLEEGGALQRQLGDPANLADTLTSLAGVAWRLCDRASAATLYQESLALQREVGNRRGMASALTGLGLVAKEYADYPRAEALFLESLAIQRDLGDKRGLVNTLINLGYTLCGEGRSAQASVHFDECLALCREIGDRYDIPVLLLCLGLVAQDRGEFERACTLYDEGLALAREVGNTPAEHWTLLQIADLAHALGHHERAATILGDILGDAQTVGDAWMVAFGLDLLAQVLCAQGQAETAARLLGAAEALRETTGMPLPPRERDKNVLIAAAIRNRLGEAAFRDARAAGRSLAAEQAVAEARVLAAGRRRLPGDTDMTVLSG